jgi:hypothetical protein
MVVLPLESAPATRTQSRRAGPHSLRPNPDGSLDLPSRPCFSQPAGASVTLFGTTELGGALPEQLLLPPADDRAGARTQARYTYQANWALWAILDRLRTSGDFAFVFEHQDDVLVFDSPSAPQSVDAFQVKTSAKSRPTRATLLRRKKLKRDPTHALSILGKLFRTKLKYQSMSRKLAVVSNLPFQVNLQDEARSPEHIEEISFEELAQADRKAIRVQLKEEHALDAEPDLDGCIVLMRARLTLPNHRNDALAKLVEVVEEKYPTTKFRPTPLYAALMEEIRRKSEDETDYQLPSDLIKNKGLARADVELRLRHALLSQDVDFAMIRQTLAVEGVPATKIQRLAVSWARYELDRSDRTNVIREILRRRVEKELRNLENEDLTLTDLVSRIGNELVRTETVPIEVSKEYLTAMILREFYETGPLPSADTQSPKEDA